MIGHASVEEVFYDRMNDCTLLFTPSRAPRSDPTSLPTSFLELAKHECWRNHLTHCVIRERRTTRGVWSTAALITPLVRKCMQRQLKASQHHLKNDFFWPRAVKQETGRGQECRGMDHGNRALCSMGAILLLLQLHYLGFWLLGGIPFPPAQSRSLCLALPCSVGPKNSGAISILHPHGSKLWNACFACASKLVQRIYGGAGVKCISLQIRMLSEIEWELVVFFLATV